MVKKRSNRQTARLENNIARTKDIEDECKGGIYDTEEPGTIVRFARILANALRIREDLIEEMQEDDE